MEQGGKEVCAFDCIGCHCFNSHKIDGVVMRSMEERKWEVLWGGGVNKLEVCFGNGLKFEGMPDEETMRLVEWNKGERR